MNHARRHLTFANVCSVLCLVLLVGFGTAHAAGLGKNSVKSKQIKNHAIKAVDLRDGAVTGAGLARGAVSGASVADGSLSAADLAAGTLTTATGGMVLKKFNWRVPNNTPPTTLVDFPGKFSIVAKCSSTGDHIDVTALTGEDHATILGSSAGGDGGTSTGRVFNRDFNVVTPFAVDNIVAESSSELARLEFVAPSGFQVSVSIAMTNTVADPNSCHVYGTALGG